MTKSAAIHAFFNGFLPAYPSASVPTSGERMPAFPYLTYGLLTDSDFSVLTLTASLWYRTESWLEINAKTEEISTSIGRGKVLECDDGGLIVRKGSPFAQSMGDESDDMIKRKIINFEFTFVTMN